LWCAVAVDAAENNNTSNSNNNAKTDNNDNNSNTKDGDNNAVVWGSNLYVVISLGFDLGVEEHDVQVHLGNGVFNQRNQVGDVIEQS